MASWFEETFGFSETKRLGYHADGKAVQRQFRITTDDDDDVTLTSKANGRSFHVGQFGTPTLKILRETLRSQILHDLNDGSIQKNAAAVQGTMTFAHLLDTDVGELIRNSASKDAVFQVASQFNLLEMARPVITPSLGVTRYAFDATQGPACALACPAATVFRNYFVPNPMGGRGQCGDASNQLDMLDAMKTYLEARSGSEEACWTMRNGYAFPTSVNMYDKLCRHIKKMDGDAYAECMGTLRCGVHWSTQVDNAAHEVCQVLCSAVPIAYAPELFVHAEENNDWPRLILEGAYEFTILCAGLLALRRGERVRCYLTQLGGGAFGNRETWICEAVYKTLEKWAALPVDVVMVHYESQLPRIYQQHS